MASRRMFSPQIVSSDAYLDMSVSARDLYFQLNMGADDDGFVDPKKTMRMIGASADDLKILIAKSFVIPFESGVVVIKHWLIHNLIRADRYKETTHLEEKDTLIVQENRRYSLATNWQPNDNQRVSQVKLSQVKLNKDTEGLGFEKFWNLYPKKVEKKKSEAKWERLSNSVREIILQDLPRRAKTDQWQKNNGQFVPNPMTYLNGERWNDVMPIAYATIDVWQAERDLKREKDKIKLNRLEAERAPLDSPGRQRFDKLKEKFNVGKSI